MRYIVSISLTSTGQRFLSAAESARIVFSKIRLARISNALCCLNQSRNHIFMQSVHQSIRMKCRRTSWKHVEPNIITYYCFDEHHKYSTIITQSAEILLLSHNMLKYYSDLSQIWRRNWSRVRVKARASCRPWLCTIPCLASGLHLLLISLLSLPVPSVMHVASMPLCLRTTCCATPCWATPWLRTTGCATPFVAGLPRWDVEASDIEALKSTSSRMYSIAVCAWSMGMAPNDFHACHCARFHT